MAKHEGETDSELKARLARLSQSLEAQAKGARQNDASQGGEAGSNAGLAWSLGVRVMSEFVAAIIVGGVIGWAVDNWLHTGPWGLIVFLMLGMAAGFWNVYRIAATPEPPAQGGSR
jgi:ATP synthase protein I